jgi:hypothetical protein
MGVEHETEPGRLAHLGTSILSIHILSIHVLSVHVLSVHVLSIHILAPSRAVQQGAEELS